jgi:arsenite-transporting ATPase
MDTAPTGHALRLIEMPALVRGWVKALMSILLKYQPVIGVGGLGAQLLRMSQGIGRLRAALADSSRSRFVVVTRAGALPRAETVRLLARLDAAGVSAPAVAINALGAGTCRRCRIELAAQRRETAALRRAAGRRRALIVTAAELPPPHGPARLREWGDAWTVLDGRSETTETRSKPHTEVRRTRRKRISSP